MTKPRPWHQNDCAAVQVPGLECSCSASDPLLALRDARAARDAALVKIKLEPDPRALEADLAFVRDGIRPALEAGMRMTEIAAQTGFARTYLYEIMRRVDRTTKRN